MTMNYKDTTSVDRSLVVSIGDGDRGTGGADFRQEVELFDLVDFQPPEYQEGETTYRNAATGQEVRRTNSWTLTDAVFTIRGYHRELVKATGVRIAGGAAAVVSNARAGAGIPEFDAYEIYEDVGGATRAVRHHIEGRIVSRSSPARSEGGLATIQFTVRPTQLYWQNSKDYDAGAAYTRPACRRWDDNVLRRILRFQERRSLEGRRQRHRRQKDRARN